MSLSTKHHRSAFSLVEVLLVLTILMLIARQTWSSSLARWFTQTDYEKLTLIQRDLARGLMLARQYAIQANAIIAFCGGDYQEANCDGDWSKGWYIESGSDIKTFHLFPLDIQVNWSGFPANKKRIDFYENGHSGYQNGTFYLCQDELVGKIILNQSGRFYLTNISELPELKAQCE